MIKKWTGIIAGVLFLFWIFPNLSVYAKDYVEKEVLLILREDNGLRPYRGEYDTENSYFSINNLENYGIAEIEKKEIKIEIEKANMQKTFSMASNETFTYYKVSLKENTVLETVAALSKLKNVAVAEPNYLYYAEALSVPDNNTDPFLEQQWYLDNLEIKTAWETLAAQEEEPGGDVVIALLDTGICTTHEDLQNCLWKNDAELSGEEGIDDDGNGLVDDINGYNFVADSGNVQDKSGHGTQMAGIMAMTAMNQTGGAGIAYGAKLLPVKVSNSGSFDTETVVQGIAYAVNQGADVINMSFGGNAESVILQTALQQASNSCILVAAAGNAGVPSVSDLVEAKEDAQNIYPAGYDCVIGVMSQDMNGNLSDFSNWDSDMNTGASYEIAAPGNGLYTTTHRGSYGVGRGTSHAAAAVSAVAAMMRGIYNDKEVWTAPILQNMFLEAMTDTVEYTYSEETLEYPVLNAMDVLEYAMKDEQLLDGMPPQGQDMTGGINYIKEEIPFLLYAEDNLGIESVNLYYRSSGIEVYSKAEMTSEGDGYYRVSTPVKFYSPGNVEYFFEIYDGTYYTYVGDRDCPQIIYIYKGNIVDAEVEGIATQYYTGKPITPAIVIKYSGKQLEEGKDYTLLYEKNIEAGTAVLHINGQGEYYGSTFLEFQIIPAPQPEEPEEPSDVQPEEPSDMLPEEPVINIGTALPEEEDATANAETVTKTETKTTKITAPGKVNKITAKRKKSGAWKFSWKKPAGKVSGYYIYVSKKKSGTYKRIAIVKKKNFTLTVKKKKKYRYVKVAAWYKCGTKRLVGKKSKAIKIN